MSRPPKVVGLMCVRDEADLLPQVLPHVRSMVDHLYVYDDGSQDDTWSLVKNEHYAVQQQPDRSDCSRANYRHLFNRIKKDFPNEEVWVVITMGDRFYLNKTPRQIVEEAKGYDAVEGVQLDFLRHRMDPWTKKNDPYPDYSNIRNLARWFKFDERCIVAYRITSDLSYDQAKYPWPRGIKKVQYRARDMDHKLSLDMPYLEHQGRRTPKAVMHRFDNGSRSMGNKYAGVYDVSTFDTTVATMGKFFLHYRMLPWIDNSSLEPFVEFFNSPFNLNRPRNRDFFRGQEALSKMIRIPPRGDLG